MEGGSTNSKKEKVQRLTSKDVNFYLTNFTCKDSSALGALGKSFKETQWTIKVGMDSQATLDLSVLVDKGLVGGPEARVSVTDQDNREKVLFPPPGPNSEQKAKLKQDFVHAWPFCGLPKNMNTPNFYEVKPQASGEDAWYSATIKEFRADEFFEALAEIPGKGSVHLPALRKEDIREQHTKDPIKIPLRELHLRIGAADPLHKVDLLVDGMERVKFARPSPKPDANIENVVKFTVDKLRSTVRAKVSRSDLDFFLNDDAKAGRIYNEKGVRTWCLWAGPYCEHEISLQVDGKVFIVSVDGTELVRSSAEDLGCVPASTFKCPFSLVGNKTVEFEVYETNRDGKTLDSQGIEKTVTLFNHDCEISCAGTSSQNATLVVNGVDFNDLPTPRSDEDEQLTLSPDALKMTYGLTVPYKVNTGAPAGVGSLLGTNSAGGPPSFGPFNFLCCNNTGVSASETA